jgi:hypothetical protein
MAALDTVITVPGLPVKVVTLPIADGRLVPSSLVMPDAGGTLVVQMYGTLPAVTHNGSGFVGLVAFITPGRMRQALTERGFVAVVEPGAYTFARSRWCPRAACRRTSPPARRRSSTSQASRAQELTNEPAHRSRRHRLARDHDARWKKNLAIARQRSG